MISTYAELQTALSGASSWTHRSDVSDLVTTFIALGEARLNRELRLRNMQASANMTLSSSTDTATLPTGFMEPISATVTVDSTPLPLTIVSLPQLDQLSRTGTGRPGYLAFTTQAEFDITADQTYSVTLRYTKALNIASDSTNWVLTRAPDAYPYAALAAMAEWSLDAQRVQMYLGLMDKAIASLRMLDAQTLGKTRLFMGFSGTGRTNILQG